MSYTSINPHDPHDAVAVAEFATPEEVEAAVAAARDVRGNWKSTPATTRGALLEEIANRLQDDCEPLVELITREVGKPITEARAEVRRAVAIHRYYAQVALLPDGDTYPSAATDTWLLARRYPIGVCCLITPWNFPLAIPAWKAAPALAHGNVVILKPSPEATAVARRYADIALRTLPSAVFTLIEGDREAGEQLVGHRYVDGISFTGSRPVGRAVAQRALARDARFQCELSGNNASIVLGDADIAAAARTIASAAMGYAGQKCTATSRIIVEQSVADDFRELLVDAVSRLGVLDPNNEGCTVGPLITADARNAALDAVGRIDGRVICGGDAVVDSSGFYLAPTLIEVASPEDSAGDEVFAPVAMISHAGNEADAIRQANLGDFGLVASVFTREIRRAMAFVDRLEVGLVRVNASTAGVDYHLPFGGIKGSGIGPREQGLAAREFYTEPKTILITS